MVVEARQALSPREARVGRESERGVPNGLLSPTLSSEWEEREKKLAPGSTLNTRPFVFAETPIG